MHGNVWQWCQDWYGDYPQKDVVDPQGAEKRGKNDKDDKDKDDNVRVLRGGSWVSFPRDCRSAFRRWFEPGSRDHTFGCRVCFCLD